MTGSDTVAQVPKVPRFLLKPRWIAFTLVVLAAMVAMVNLGLWQLRRHDERARFNALLDQRAGAAAVDAAPLLAPGADPQGWTWRTVTLHGTYTARPTVEVINRSLDGDQGRWVVNTFTTTAGDTVIVNRGWVSVDAPIPPPPVGEVELAARVKPSETRRTGQPSDDVSEPLTQVRRVDVALLRGPLGASGPSVYFDVLSPAAAGLSTPPLPGRDAGPHLGYAAQWFIFTACAAIGWVLAVRRSAAGAAERDGTAPPRRRRGPPPIDEEASARLGTGLGGPPAGP